MGIGKTRLLMPELMYWGEYECGYQNTIKQCATFLEYQQSQAHKKTIPYDIPCKPWEVVGADIFSINNNTLLCIVDY